MAVRATCYGCDESTLISTARGLGEWTSVHEPCTVHVVDSDTGESVIPPPKNPRVYDCE